MTLYIISKKSIHKGYVAQTPIQRFSLYNTSQRQSRKQCSELPRWSHKFGRHLCKAIRQKNLPYSKLRVAFLQRQVPTRNSKSSISQVQVHHAIGMRCLLLSSSETYKTPSIIIPIPHTACWQFWNWFTDASKHYFSVVCWVFIWKIGLTPWTSIQVSNHYYHLA